MQPISCECVCVLSLKYSRFQLNRKWKWNDLMTLKEYEFFFYFLGTLLICISFGERRLGSKEWCSTIKRQTNELKSIILITLKAFTLSIMLIVFANVFGDIGHLFGWTCRSNRVGFVLKSSKRQNETELEIHRSSRWQILSFPVRSCGVIRFRFKMKIFTKHPIKLIEILTNSIPLDMTMILLCTVNCHLF